MSYDPEERGRIQAVVSVLWVPESPHQDEEGIGTEVLSAASGAAHGLRVPARERTERFACSEQVGSEQLSRRRRMLRE